VDLDAFNRAEPLDLRQSFSLPDDRLIAVHLANLREVKDHRTMLHAIARMHDSGRLQVLLVGDFCDPSVVSELDALIDELGLRHCLVTVGPRSDVAELLLGADLGLLSSRSEAGPLALIEYLAAGLPFVVTDVGENVGGVAAANAGAIVAPGDIGQFAIALDQLVSMSFDERSAMGRRGRRVVEELFDQRTAVRSVEGVYENLSLS
jgi:glycosyltransferase involved in cell wall biosynthesis